MESKSVVLGAVLAGLVFGAVATAALVGAEFGAPTAPTGTTSTPNSSTADPVPPTTDDSLPTFEDSADFVAYVDRGQSQTGYVAARGMAGGGGDAAGAVDVARERTVTATVEEASATRRQGTAASESGATAGDDGGTGSDRRVGTTNVQVTGVDEPDIVKTDGQRFYYAPRGRTSPPPGRAGPERVDDRRTEVVRADGVARPERPPGQTHVLDTSSPADPAAVAAINASGKLLQVGDSLVVLGHREIRGYNVSDPDSPESSWSRSLNGSLVTARVTGGQLYLVTRTPARVSEPCPVEPVGGVAVSCSDIHHPREQIPVDATYTALAVDPASGDLIDATSFVGTTRNTVVHMASDALYVTYTKSAGRADAALTYLTEESELVPDSVRERLREIDSYDISRRSKLRETSATIQRWRQSLPEDRRREVSDQLGERFRAYVAENKRQFTTTGIVRVGVGGTGSDGDGLGVEAVGEVPGRPLNQFSMSQHDGTLRIATTIPRTSGAESENDLYVLDATSLDRIGAETGMGETERVYAVRYVGDTAYVVTFRRVDPFHVVDLSDPSDPEEVGELKLPGFSSYLHPVDDSHVLGVGEEDGEVKAVLFDVSDPSDPTIDDTLRLEKGWSAVAETHHAFTHDERHGVFFLPAGRQGLIVDYTDGSLDVEKRIRTAEEPARARYVGDYLYVFAGETVDVLDETTWESVTGLSL
jgi:inhibitor of cysteine peptidase